MANEITGGVTITGNPDYCQNCSRQWTQHSNWCYAYPIYQSASKRLTFRLLREVIEYAVELGQNQSDSNITDLINTVFVAKLDDVVIG